jgi:dTDP-glucose 4,6-dehydratase
MGVPTVASDVGPYKRAIEGRDFPTDAADNSVGKISWLWMIERPEIGGSESSMPPRIARIRIQHRQTSLQMAGGSRMHVLLTGGAGFIASHIVEHIRATRPDWRISIIDRLNYAGSLDRLARWRADEHIQFLFHDFRASFNSGLIAKLGKVNAIIHAGAETHVDNSLADPQVFVESNVLGTFHLLEAARTLKVDKFVMVSTDEVFGPAPMGIDFAEDAKYNPSNPYSATKAAGECLCMAWAKSFGVPMLITRTMNNFGERQHPEKFVPKAIRASMRGEPLDIHMHKKGSNISVSVRATGCMQETMRMEFSSCSIKGKAECSTSLESRKTCWKWPSLSAASRGTGRGLKTQHMDVNGNRPGHDLRYALDDSKLRKMGWNPPIDFEESLSKTIKWTLENKVWLS